MTERAKRTIGHVEVERELGQGGMGVVRLGRQGDLDRAIVIKTLRKGLAEDPTLDERFLREARTAAAVHHQNVVAVYDCFSFRGERLIVQEYVDGVDLATALESVKQIPPRIAALLALEVVRGLEEIHALGIVHRDLKPSNILLSRAGATKIADFGIALGGEGPGLTQTGHAVGTPLYMAPEQLIGETAEDRSDLFALGVLLYEMLAGRPPYLENDAESKPGGALVRRMEARRYPRLRRLAPEVPRAFAALVNRCLQPRPKRRPGSATELREALERLTGAVSPGECRAEIAAFLWEKGVFSEEDGGTIVLRRGVRRRRAWVAPVRWATAALVSGLLIAAAATLDHLLAAPVGAPSPVGPSWAALPASDPDASLAFSNVGSGPEGDAEDADEGLTDADAVATPAAAAP